MNGWDLKNSLACDTVISSRLITLAAALLAGDVSRRQEPHLNLLNTRPFARFTTAAHGIEGEATRLEAADFGIRSGAEQLAY